MENDAWWVPIEQEVNPKNLSLQCQNIIFRETQSLASKDYSTVLTAFTVLHSVSLNVGPRMRHQLITPTLKAKFEEIANGRSNTLAAGLTQLLHDWEYLFRNEALGTAYADILAALRRNNRAAPGIKVSDAALKCERHPSPSDTLCRLSPLRGFNFSLFNQRARFQSAHPMPASAVEARPANPAAPAPSPPGWNNGRMDVHSAPEIVPAAQSPGTSFERSSSSVYAAAAHAHSHPYGSSENRASNFNSDAKRESLGRAASDPPMAHLAQTKPGTAPASPQPYPLSAVSHHETHVAKSVSSGGDSPAKRGSQPLTADRMVAMLPSNDVETPQGTPNSSAQPLSSRYSADPSLPKQEPPPQVGRAVYPPAMADGGKQAAQPEGPHAHRTLGGYMDMDRTMNPTLRSSKRGLAPPAMPQALIQEHTINAAPKRRTSPPSDTAQKAHTTSRPHVPLDGDQTLNPAPKASSGMRSLKKSPSNGGNVSFKRQSSSRSVEAVREAVRLSDFAAAGTPRGGGPVPTPFVDADPDSSNNSSLQHGGRGITAATPERAHVLLQRAGQHAAYLTHLCDQADKARRVGDAREEAVLKTTCAREAQVVKHVHNDVTREKEGTSGSVRMQLDVADEECQQALQQWEALDSVAQETPINKSITTMTSEGTVASEALDDIAPLQNLALRSSRPAPPPMTSSYAAPPPDSVTSNAPSIGNSMTTGGTASVQGTTTITNDLTETVPFPTFLDNTSSIALPADAMRTAGAHAAPPDIAAASSGLTDASMTNPLPGPRRATPDIGSHSIAHEDSPRTGADNYVAPEALHHPSAAVGADAADMLPVDTSETLTTSDGMPNPTPSVHLRRGSLLPEGEPMDGSALSALVSRPVASPPAAPEVRASAARDEVDETEQLPEYRLAEEAPSDNVNAVSTQSQAGSSTTVRSSGVLGNGAVAPDALGVETEVEKTQESDPLGAAESSAPAAQGTPVVPTGPEQLPVAPPSPPSSASASATPANASRPASSLSSGGAAPYIPASAAAAAREAHPSSGSGGMSSPATSPAVAAAHGEVPPRGHAVSPPLSGTLQSQRSALSLPPALSEGSSDLAHFNQGLRVSARRSNSLTASSPTARAASSPRPVAITPSKLADGSAFVSVLPRGNKTKPLSEMPTLAQAYADAIPPEMASYFAAPPSESNSLSAAAAKADTNTRSGGKDLTTLVSTTSQASIQFGGTEEGSSLGRRTLSAPDLSALAEDSVEVVAYRMGLREAALRLTDVRYISQIVRSAANRPCR